ncbi:uncharacterized protein LOC128952825 [Oppia nitens]|uniref:uncharacterized protein LOC128952825 n=1 Tax=Oppia nitens TaxID=1686743 RepID=UPI0023DB65B7|nr:uncharacterized protein LOC128952825 [Oppia nitens]
MSSLDDSVVIITFDCNVCHQSSDLLIDNRCPHCNSRVVETTSGQSTSSEDEQNSQLSDQSVADENVVNMSIKLCSICLDTLADGTKALKCGHSFHKQCIYGWIATKHNTCPLCRQLMVVSQPVLPVTFDSSQSSTTATHLDNEIRRIRIEIRRRLTENRMIRIEINRLLNHQ